MIHRMMLVGVILISMNGIVMAAENDLSERKITKPIDVIATGGAGVADTTRFGIVFMNPAAYGASDFKGFSILRVGARVNYDLYDLAMIGFYLSTNSNDFDSLTPDQWITLFNLNTSLGINGPLALGYIGNGIALLLYDDIYTRADVKQAPGLPYVAFESYLDIGFIVGYGFEVASPLFLGKFNELCAGINLKYLNRMKHVDDRMSILEALDMGYSIMSFKKGFLMGQNISSDIGLILKSPHLSFGVMIRDWFSTGFIWSEYDVNFNKIDDSTYPNTYFYPALDVGMKWSTKPKLVPFLISDISIYFDIANALDFTEHYLLKLRMGIETTCLAFLKVRAGFYKGYPSFGLGIDLPLVKINSAYYTEEWGNMPGAIPQENFMLDIQLVI